LGITEPLDFEPGGNPLLAYYNAKAKRKATAKAAPEPETSTETEDA
jgi:hypothetical protein